MHSVKLKAATVCIMMVTSFGLWADGEKVAIWTGGTSDSWTEPSNWKDGVVPGRYLAKDENNHTVTNGSYGWTVRFEREWARWVINLNNFVSVSNLVFTGKQDTQQVGYAGQRLYLEDGGGIYVESSNSKQNISILATIGIDEQKQANVVYHIKNDSSKSLKIVNGFYPFKMASGVWGYPQMRFEGSGKTWLQGGFPSANGYYSDLGVALDESGELHVTNTVDNFRALVVPAGLPTQHIIIKSGSSLRPAHEFFRQLDARSDVEISGAGKIRFKMADMGNKGTGHICVGSGATATIAVPVEQAYAGAEARFNVWDGSGTLRFTGGNSIPQDIGIRKATVEARVIGMAGEAGDIGLGNKILIERGGTLRYTGSGETTDRMIEIGYYTNVLEQAGTGPVIFTGCVTSLAYQATLVLSNDTDVAATYAGAIVSGVQHPIIRKRGTGEWILSGANTTEEMFYHEGGTLTVGSASSLPRLTVAGGGTLKIADGVTLTLPTTRFIYNSGTLDVVPGAGSKFIVSDAARGPAPEWLTINGRPAKYKANGELAMANLGIVIIFR